MAANAVQLDAENLEVILDRLDAGGTDFPGRGANEEFFPYRHPGLTLRLVSAGSPTFRVPTRQISAKHVVLLHPAYIHVGTRGAIELVTTHNCWHSAEGTIVACRHVAGRVHEAVLRMARDINVSQFVRCAVKRNVLVVDDEPTCSALVGHFLKQMKVQVTTASNGKAAVEAALQSHFDLIMMDLEMPEMGGIEAIKELRSRGYHRRVVAVTAMTEPGDRERCIEAGFDDYVTKPITREALAAAMEGLEEEPLFSSMAGQENLDPLINTFVKSLEARMKAIREALTAKDAKALSRIARTLKGEAASYGFQPITDAAALLEKADHADQPWEATVREVHKVLKICGLAQPTDPGATAG